VVIRLLNRVSVQLQRSWFELNDAALQIRPLQEKIPVA